MRLTNLFFIALFSIPAIVSGQQYDSAYGKPLIILTETNPWLMVIGSDVPSFALYEKGQIIYKVIEDRRQKLYQVTLTQEELKKVIDSFSISEAFYKLPDNIEASSSTDQPENILKVCIEPTKTVNVYGRLGDKGEARKNTPGAFLEVYDCIKGYKSSSAKEWLPAKIEVMFWDYDYAPEKSPWPAGFPDLNSPETVKRGDMYSVYIDKGKFEELKEYMASLGEREAVEINNRKMAIAFRLPFPNLK